MSLKLLQQLQSSAPIVEEKEPKEINPNSNELRVLFIVGSLKKEHSESNTYALCQLAEQQLKLDTTVNTEFVYLSTLNIATGITEQVEDQGDQMAEVYNAIKRANVVIFATPIWWGNYSSLIQKVIERMDAFDEIFLHEDKNILQDKVFGVVVSGAEDGVQSVNSSLCGWASSLGFTIPPHACLYSFEQVDGDSNKLKDKELKDTAEEFASNIIRIAKMLKVK